MTLNNTYANKYHQIHSPTFWLQNFLNQSQVAQKLLETIEMIEAMLFFGRASRFAVCTGYLFRPKISECVSLFVFYTCQCFPGYHRNIAYFQGGNCKNCSSLYHGLYPQGRIYDAMLIYRRKVKFQSPFNTMYNHVPHENKYKNP